MYLPGNVSSWFSVQNPKIIWKLRLVVIKSVIITIRFLTNLPLTLIMFSLKPHILPLAVHLVFVVILKSEQVEGIILHIRHFIE